MDPTTAYKTMTDDGLPIDERAESAEALRGWLRDGGFVPLGLPRTFAGNTAARFFVEQRIDETLIEAEQEGTR